MDWAALDEYSVPFSNMWKLTNLIDPKNTMWITTGKHQLEVSRIFKSIGIGEADRRNWLATPFFDQEKFEKDQWRTKARNNEVVIE